MQSPQAKQLLPGLLYVILLLVFEGGSCNDVFNCLLLATSTPDVCLGHPWDIPFPKQTGWIGRWGKSLIFWSILWLSVFIAVGWIVQGSGVEQIVLVILYAHGCVKLDDLDQTWAHVFFCKVCKGQWLLMPILSLWAYKAGCSWTSGVSLFFSDVSLRTGSCQGSLPDRLGTCFRLIPLSWMLSSLAAFAFWRWNTIQTVFCWAWF